MGFSVNSMAGVTSALRHIDSLQRESAPIYERIATGLKVGDASDDGRTWAMAQGLRASHRALGTTVNSIDLGIGVVETALVATEGISDLMIEMKEKLVAATDETLDDASWRALMEEYVMLGNQAQRLVENASFNGANLLEAGASDYSVLVAAKPDQIMTIAAEDLSDGGGLFDSAFPGGLPQDDSSALTTRPTKTMVDALDASIDAVNAAATRFGVGLKALNVHRGLVVKQADITEQGIGNLVDADLGREKARLESAMVREELGIKALSIANRAPRIILQFFQ